VVEKKKRGFDRPGLLPKREKLRGGGRGQVCPWKQITREVDWEGIAAEQVVELKNENWIEAHTLSPFRWWFWNPKGHGGPDEKSLVKKKRERQSTYAKVEGKLSSKG